MPKYRFTFKSAGEYNKIKYCKTEVIEVPIPTGVHSPKSGLVQKLFVQKFADMHDLNIKDYRTRTTIEYLFNNSNIVKVEEIP